MLGESVPLLLIAARNVEQLLFRTMLRDQQVQEIGPILQSNTCLKHLNIENRHLFKRCLYSFESLCEFIKVITAPEPQLERKVAMGWNNIRFLPESLITGRT